MGGKIFLLLLLLLAIPAQAWENYDTNGDGVIGDLELISAIMDWLNGKIDDATLLDVIMAWLQPPGFQLEFGKKYQVEVVDVIDGDTIDVRLPNGTIERVRMLGVDTPETTASENEPYEYDDITDLQCLAEWGLQAKQFAESYLAGKTVYIEFDELAGFRGYYGRLLAYVYLENGTDFTAELVKRGYARVYVEGTFAKEDEYLQYQQAAIDANLGLWSCAETQFSSTGDVRISYVHYDAYGNDHYNLNDEYVILRNHDDVSVNLEGWWLEDEAGHYYVFPYFVLEPGASVKVHSGCGIDTITDLYWCSDWAIWNNDGDTAYLYNSQGVLVDTYSW